jgi:hypothetical protein
MVWVRRDHASPPRKRDKSAGKARAVSEVKVEIFQTFKNSMKESMTVSRSGLGLHTCLIDMSFS